MNPKEFEKLSPEIQTIVISVITGSQIAFMKELITESEKHCQCKVLNGIGLCSVCEVLEKMTEKFSQKIDGSKFEIKGE